MNVRKSEVLRWETWPQLGRLWDDGKAAQVYNASLIFNFDFVFYQVRLSCDDLLCAEHTNRD